MSGELFVRTGTDESGRPVLDETCELHDAWSSAHAIPQTDGAVAFHNTKDIEAVLREGLDPQRSRLKCKHICLAETAEIAAGLDLGAAVLRVDVTGLDLRSYRRHLAVVPQESLLFEGSVRANVTYGSPELTDDDVRAALRDANALDFVEQMGGLDAVIGERGARLSGGQRQRIAIARALIRDPRVLVLDEATSALDTASERLVQEALARLMRGRTTFVVAHRLSTIQGADRIAVMRAGRLVEIGSHAELMAADGAYAALQGQAAQPR